MARASATAEPLRSSSVRGPAATLISPSYQRMLRAEPLLRRAVPGLIVMFLVTLAASAYLQERNARAHALEAAAGQLGLAAALVQARLDPAALEQTAQRLAGLPAPPPGIAVFAIQAGHPLAAWPAGAELPLLVKSAASTGDTGLSILREDDTAILAMQVRDGDLSVIAVQRQSEALALWRDWASFLTLVSATTGGVLFILGFAFYWQASRASRADDIYDAVRARLEMALSHGRCGLWDWDLDDGHIFWSDSMFALLGQTTPNRMLSEQDVDAMIHPQDGGFTAFVADLERSGHHTVDRRFRIRTLAGDWLHVRARGELIVAGGNHRLIGIVVDETEERLFFESARVADTRLRDAIEALSEAFVLWDAQSRLVICNSKFQRLHRLPDALVTPGTHYADVAEAGSHVVRTQFSPELSTAQGGRTFDVQLGDGRWLAINERRTREGGYVSVGTDITSLKEQQQRLLDGEQQLRGTIADLKRSRQILQRQAKDLSELADKYAEQTVRAEAASRAKSEFLANVSHELRTPLNAIIGFSDLMAEETFGPLTGRYAGYCRDIAASGRELLGFVDDVLEVSTIGSDGVRLRREPVAIPRELSAAVDEMRQDFEGKNLTIYRAWPEHLPIEADRRCLRLSLRHLISNAIKFTGVGGQIRLCARQIGNRVAIFVEDTGIGIPPGLVVTLGQPFEQVQPVLTRGHKGSGLGLSIARSLIRIQGGSLRIRSALGTGTVVMITLPVLAPTEGPLARWRAPGAELAST